jgi:hypothetical protein
MLYVLMYFHLDLHPQAQNTDASYAYSTSDKADYVNFVVHFVRITPSAERLHRQALRGMWGSLPTNGTCAASWCAGALCPLLAPIRLQHIAHAAMLPRLPIARGDAFLGELEGNHRVAQALLA